MANKVKVDFLETLSKRYGPLRKLAGSLSLYALDQDRVRVYIRYSRVHNQQRTFYGLRAEDLRQIAGHESLICFLWDGQKEPLFLRFSDYEEVFHSTCPAADGQYKVQIYPRDGATELYIAQAGRFNVEGNIGWNDIEAVISASGMVSIPEFTHAQMQTLLGAIGITKGFDVWIPSNDRNKLDWSIAESFTCADSLPSGFQEIEKVVREIDVIWMPRGSSEPQALFEVEHSTPIYSGLLRFNDVHLLAPRLRPRYSVVANDTRRDVYVRQLNRPTFRFSGLSELCTFLDYKDVFGWFNRTRRF